MNIILNDRYSLTEQMWYEHMKTLRPENVRIIGRVVGQVIIRDINKIVQYNQILDISVDEVRRSADLLAAYSKDWIDVIEGKQYVQKMSYSSEKPVINEPVVYQEQKPSINKDEIKELFREMLGQSTAAILQELKKESSKNVDVDEIVNKIVDKLPTVQPQKVNNEIDKSVGNVFVNIDDGKELKTNINGDIGDVTQQKDIKAKSVAKKIKQINKN